MPSEWMWLGVAHTALPCTIKPLWVFQPVFDSPCEGSIPIDAPVALYDGALFNVNDPADWPWAPAMQGFVLGIFTKDWLALKNHLRHMRCVLDDEGQPCAWPWFNPTYWRVLSTSPGVPLGPFLGPVQQLILADPQGSARIDLTTEPPQPLVQPSAQAGYNVLQVLSRLSVQHHCDRLWVWCERVQRQSSVLFTREDLSAWVEKCGGMGLRSPYQQAVWLVCALWCGAHPLHETSDLLERAIDLGMPLQLFHELHMEFSSQPDYTKPFVRQQREQDCVALYQAQLMSLNESRFLGSNAEVFVPCWDEAKQQELKDDLAQPGKQVAWLQDQSQKVRVVAANGKTWSILDKAQLSSCVLQQARQWPKPKDLQLHTNPVLDHLAVLPGGQTFFLFDARRTSLAMEFNSTGASAQVNHGLEVPLTQTIQNVALPCTANLAVPTGFDLDWQWKALPPTPLLGQFTLRWQWQHDPLGGLQFSMQLGGELQLTHHPLQGTMAGHLNGHAFELALELPTARTWVLDAEFSRNSKAAQFDQTLLRVATDWPVTGVLQAVQAVGEHRLALATAVLGQLHLECMVQFDPSTRCVKPVIRLAMGALKARLIASHPVLGTRHVNIPCAQSTTLAQWELSHG